MTQKNDDVFNQEEERYLKSYYQKLDQQWGVDPSTSEVLRRRFAAAYFNTSRLLSNVRYKTPGGGSLTEVVRVPCGRPIREYGLKK